jgi:enoyl-CoA hydratase
MRSCLIRIRKVRLRAASSRFRVATATGILTGCGSLTDNRPHSKVAKMNPQASPLVLVRRDGPLARISLNRPEKHNAMNLAMLEQLDDAVRGADADPDVRVIVISGEGRSFSTGHDMKESEQDPRVAELRASAEGLLAFESHYYYQFSLNVRNTKTPTIAQVHGHCLAAGLALVAMCDLAVASDDARFGVPVVRFGLASGEMGYEVWEIGAKLAKELLFTGDQIDAQTAKEWGFLNRVVPRDKLEETITAMAMKIAAQPPTAVSLLKASINGALDGMGQSNSLRQHFITHLLSHSLGEAKANRAKREAEGKAAWTLGAKPER